MLRGPQGQAISYVRLGSTPAADTILDIYQIVYEGLQAPIQLYVDEYNYAELIAPAGFVCASPFPI